MHDVRSACTVHVHAFAKEGTLYNLLKLYVQALTINKKIIQYVHTDPPHSVGTCVNQPSLQRQTSTCISTIVIIKHIEEETHWVRVYTLECNYM